MRSRQGVERYLPGEGQRASGAGEAPEVRRKLLIQALLVGAAFVIAGIIGFGIWSSLDSRELIWQHAVRSSENIVGTLEHDIRRNIETYDLSLQAVVEGLAQEEISSLTPKLQNLVLFDRAATAQYLGSIMVLDEKGDLIIDSASLVPRGGNFADREYFKVHLARKDLGLAISHPFYSRLDQQWELGLSRRLEHRDGSFAGVVVGTMQLSFFRGLFQGVDLGPDGSLSLASNDMSLVAHLPYDETLIGRNLSDAELFRRYPKERAGWFEFTANRDRINRLFVYQQIGDLPLVLSLGTSSVQIFAEWRQKTILVAAAVLGLTLLAGLFAALSFSELRRRARAEAVARTSEANYRLLAEYSTDMIVRAGLDGVRQYVSPACRRLLGYEPEELIGTRASDFIHPDDRADAQSMRRRLESGERQVTTAYRGRRKDGHYVWLESSRRVFVDPVDGQTKMIGLVRDITERKQFELEMQAAKLLAEDANEAKSRFLADMSHELRTPLNAVIGFSDLISRATLGPLGNPGYQEYAEEIRKGGEHLLELINEVLDHAKASSGRLELQEELVDPRSVMDFAVRMLKHRAEQGSIVLKSSFEANVYAVRGDEKRLKQILINLISNAIKFTPPGGQVMIAASLGSGGELVLSVRDTGVGIPEDEQVRVFEPYTQSRRAPFGDQSGTGLGLPLTKRLVELHQGTLTLRSTVGVGTIVTITLPAARVIAELPVRQGARGLAE
jgi:PAS domain S-box-containing protein